MIWEVWCTQPAGDIRNLLGLRGTVCMRLESVPSRHARAVYRRKRRDGRPDSWRDGAADRLWRR
jgi:hypothetical protein